MFKGPIFACQENLFHPATKFVFVFQNRLSPLTDKLGDVPALGDIHSTFKSKSSGIKRPLWV